MGGYQYREEQDEVKEKEQRVNFVPEYVNEERKFGDQDQEGIKYIPGVQFCKSEQAKKKKQKNEEEEKCTDMQEKERGLERKAQKVEV